MLLVVLIAAGLSQSHPNVVHVSPPSPTNSSLSRLSSRQHAVAADLHTQGEGHYLIMHIIINLNQTNNNNKKKKNRQQAETTP